MKKVMEERRDKQLQCGEKGWEGGCMYVNRKIMQYFI